MGYVTFNAICAAVSVAAGVATWWMVHSNYRRRLWLSEAGLGWDDQVAKVRLNVARKLLRAKFLAGGYGKHRAYHVTDGGFVLVADAVDFYFALSAGLDDFWEIPGEIHQLGHNDFTVRPDEIALDNLKGDFTCIHGMDGDTYVDTIILQGYPPYSDFTTRVTAEEFKKAVVERKAEASKRG